MKLAAWLFALATAVAAPSLAMAQSVPAGCSTTVQCVNLQPFLPTGTTTLSASSASSNTALATTGNAYYAQVVNGSSSVGAWVAVGGSAVTATAASPSIYVAPGASVAIPLANAGYIAAITASSTAALTINTGTGVPSSVGGASGGGGGAVTIASGAVAAGAYSAGSLATGSGVDGWNLTEGTKSDAAYAGSGSSSIVAALKGIYAALVAALPAGANIIGKVGIDQTTPGTTNGVVINSGNAGGFDSGPVQASSSVNSSSHSAGQSLGGLLTLSVADTSGGSGGISAIAYKSSKGSTGQIVVRIWAHNPTNTTCTDNTAFVGSATDDAFLLTPPFTLTPAAPAVTTGDANTYAALLPGRLSFKASGNTNVYACAVTVATDTTDESGTVYIIVSGDLNS